MAKTLFSDGNPLQGILGTIVNAAFLNKIFSHRHDGLDQDGSAPLDYAVDQGVANSYAIALAPALTAHVAGLPIHFKAANANTAASMLAINGLAAVAIKQVDGSDLPAGAIVAGQMVTVIYTGNVYMLISGRGIATPAEVATGTDVSKSVTPAGLVSGLLGSGGGTASDYCIIPFRDKSTGARKNLILQWGRRDNSTYNETWNAVTFPIAFPTACLNASVTMAMSGFTSDSPAPMVRSTTMTTTGMEIGVDIWVTPLNNNTLFWAAIGL